MKLLSLVLISSVFFVACKQIAPSTPQTQSPAQGELDAVEAALQAGRPVTCVMTKADGSATTTSKLKDKKMKVTGITVEGQAPGSMISDGAFFYTWDDAKKEGVKMAIPAQENIKELAQKQGQAVPDFTSQEDRTTWENQGYQVNCTEGDIPDSEFVPPMDVTFTDLGGMMQDLGTQMQEIQTDQGMDAEKLKKLQEQFGGQ